MAQVLAGLLVAAGIALAALALSVARRERQPAGRPLAVLLLAAAWWGVAGAVELSVADPAARVLWGDLKYVGIVLVPPSFLLFVLYFTGRGTWVTRRTVALLAVEPVLLLTALAVPRTHDLVRYLPADEVGEALPVVATGPLFVVHAVYGYVVVLVALVTFLRGLVRTSRAYRRLSWELGVAAVVPWLANVLFIAEVGIFALVDLTPFLFVLTGGVLVQGLLHGRRLSLARVARDVVVDGMADGVVVVDAFHRVVEVNRAARTLLRAERLLGAPVDALLPGDDDHVTLADDDGSRRDVEVRRSPLLDRSGAEVGEVLVLRDVTERLAARRRVDALLEERTRVAAALQTALLPPQLPEVPGLAVAALYQPSGEGREIGGDFYELFPLADGAWCAVLGDVAGKGAAAAAVTARVRFTLRALAARGAPAEDVLRGVNAAVVEAGDPERFCTLAHLVLRPHEAGVSVQLVLAGHLPPLVRRRDGRVSGAGSPGTALGLVADPDLSVVALELAPGEAVCLFTDGLVEARDADGRQLGAEGVAAALAAADPSAPDDVVAGLAAVARQWHGGHLDDDLAVLLMVAADGAGRGDAQRGR
ncbi:PP2C family protein-serine/threonine phosphatase [Aquipuribacter nitratireducens]|uniref:PP2C family protein-serine/threonine phosphatase n=1 Tax=Aquipuribacter nitratireducens TaxID=650104 RepID=A0ABW0GMG2_9MICO